jgi:hypothetical protein
VRASLLPVAALWVACLATGSRLHGAAESPTSLTANAPVINFRVTTFTREGFRSWLLAGAEGRYVSQDRLDVVNLNLTVFTGNAANRVDSVFLSPAATAYLEKGQVGGPGAVRLITDDFEATGADWLYDHRQKKVSIRKNVRVVFHAQLQGLIR